MNPDLRWRGVFRIPTARMVGGDYTTGAFFVTWCVKGRVECLARIEDGQSFPTLIGMIVDEEWRATAIVRPNVTLDAWIVMPDHVHGILILHDAKETAGMEETAHRAVSTGSSRLQAGSLGAIIGQIKSIATKRIRAAGCPEFEWQTRFHDRILRNEAALIAARKYIADNPSRWEQDRDNPDGLFR
mgnify:CR=1 FL=1|jgi:REP element-mobilizing transposase RayT